MNRPGEAARRVLWTALFAAAFGFVEAAVVVYLRALYYPEGFQFPLRLMAPAMVPVELIRELATLVMLASVGILAGRSRWDRFGAFMVTFGVWDITFYIWLKVLVAWPASIRLAYDREFLYVAIDARRVPTELASVPRAYWRSYPEDWAMSTRDRHRRTYR